MIKGKEKEQSIGVTNHKYVGFTSVEVRAVNPSRSELNKLLGKEDENEDKEITYLTQDNEGNDRIRLSFWLYSEKFDKYFVHSFNLTNKKRTSKDGLKNQYVNNTCITAWADEEKNLPEWFTAFQDREKNNLGKKEFRQALLGEEELATLLRAWAGKMTWTDPGCSVLIDTKSLFAEDYSELRSIIGSDYETPFVILLGVRTDENDMTKQYQQVYGKSFLPGGFMKYLEKGFKFPTDYTKKTWDRFVDEVEGEYGFNSYFELVPALEYDSAKDVAAIPGAKADVTPVNAKF